MELRLRCRRSTDRRTYEDRAFYFINPAGHWVNENDASLDDSVYGEIKAAAVHGLRKDIVPIQELHDDGHYRFIDTPDVLHRVR